MSVAHGRTLSNPSPGNLPGTIRFARNYATVIPTSDATGSTLSTPGDCQERVITTPRLCPAGGELAYQHRDRFMSITETHQRVTGKPVVQRKGLFSGGS